MEAKIYEGSKGIVLNVEISGIPDFTLIEYPKFLVLPPNSLDELEWPAEIIVDESVLRCYIPNEYNLIPGIYKIQPYFTYVSFTGRWSTTSFTIYRKFD